MTRNQTIERMFSTIGTDGILALVAEGQRRRMTTRAIAKHLNIPMSSAEFFALGHENEFPLNPGERVRMLADAMGWCGNGTVIAQQYDDEFIRLRKDGAPEKIGCIVSALRHEVVLTDMPELLPEGATFNDCGYLVVPCEPTPDGKHLHFYCPHCKKWHLHGIGNGGYVGANCQKHDSQLLARGSIFLLPKSVH